MMREVRGQAGRLHRKASSKTKPLLMNDSSVRHNGVGLFPKIREAICSPLNVLVMSLSTVVLKMKLI